MSLSDLEKRMTLLEKAVEELRARVYPAPGQQVHWWRDEAGRFAEDPLFDEMVRWTENYRKTQVKKTRKTAKKSHAHP
jgi:hypothetical protein